MEIDKIAENIYLFRKSALAKVLVCYNSSGRGDININGFHCTEYLQGNPRFIYSPISLLGQDGNYNVQAYVSGGGLSGQAEAILIRLGISRALSKLLTAEDRKKLRIYGFLTRNSLCKERRKYGLKKSRKAPQFSKR
uniref:ribosomal protein S9 n=1 Tax=Euglena agilis TaxID=96764 RepID=UPI0023AACA6C|nr:ribosomal protein S9 [Euglena agilis]WCH63309.1 ribosomal protein S9 [Euglena agilis]